MTFSEYGIQLGLKGLSPPDDNFFLVRNSKSRPLDEPVIYKKINDRRQIPLPRPVGLTALSEKPVYGTERVTDWLKELGTPDEVINQLKPHLNRKEIRRIMTGPINFPHSAFHRDQVRMYARHIAVDMVKNEKTVDEIDKAAYFHDEGWRFYDKKILPVKYHQYGSAALALSYTGNKHIAKMILAHVNYKRPEEMPLEEQILTLSDRLAGLGYTEVVRLAWVLGFRHKDLEPATLTNGRIVEKRMEDEVLTHWRRRMHFMSGYDFNAVYELMDTDCEAEVKSFCQTEVVPWLKSRGYAEKVAKQLWRNQNYLYRHTYPILSVEGRIPDRIWDEKNYDFLIDSPVAYYFIQVKQFMHEDAYSELMKKDA